MSLKKRGKYRFQDFEVDLGHRSVHRDGHTITISPRTFDLLVYFVLNPQRIVTKDELMDALWPDSHVEESNLSQHIFLLRKALTGAQSGDKLILTVPGRGYQFALPVTEVPSPAKDETPDPDRVILHAVDSVTSVSVEELTDDEHPNRGPIAQFLAGFRHPGPWQVLAITATLAILGLGGLFAWRWTHRTRPQSLSLVFADFDNSTGDPEFDLALKTAASIDLQQSPYLNVASRTKIDQTLKDMKAAPGASLNPQTAREVCTRLNDQAYLAGSIHRFVRKYMVTLEAFDCASGRSLAASKGIASSPDGIVDVLDRVAVDLRKQLGESSSSVTQFSKPLFAARTASLSALKAYSDANHLGLEGKQQDAILLLQRAVEIDPQFAIAFADLGVVYSNLGEQDLSRAALTRAYDLRDTVDEPDRLFIVGTYNSLVTGDMEASIRNNQSWSQEYPQNPVPLIDLADLETQSGRPAQAIEPVKRALALNPDNSYAYEVLARAQLHLNQVDEAAATCRQAIDRGFDGTAIHQFLLQIAFLRLDQAGIDSQMAWARDKSALPAMLLQQGLMDFALGKAKAAQASIERAADEYRKQGQPERAARIVGGMPRILAELGLLEAARTQLSHLSESDGYTIQGSLNGSIDIPVAWAHVGETSRAEAILKRELDANLTGTLWQKDFGPQIRAAIALNQQHPAAAISDLESALPYEMRSFDVPALRGKAYLAAKQPEQAETEFHKIVDHPGIEPLSHNYPLARLGLARALAMEGKTTDAENAYNLFFNIWKEADPDLPRLRDARAEYARLTGTAAKISPTASKPANKPTAAKPRHK
jgi:DNA-binding winged helix-turn-helix (wHTH) protein/tetratricopeptide (TPR) repeat protein